MSSPTPGGLLAEVSPTLRYQFWIVVAAVAIFFTNLGSTALFDMDEALYATCAREMLGRGDWVVPYFNGQEFYEKPPLMFWTMIAGFELFGINSELGARFFSAVMGVGTALIAFHLGRILFNLRVGAWAGVITASTIVFTISARAATVDSGLTFFTALAFLMFVIGWKKGYGATDTKSTVSNPQSLIPNPFPLSYAIACYACIGIAVVGKGPVGMVLPLAAMGLFLIVTYGWRNLFRSALWMRPLTALVVLAVVGGSWYVLVGLQTDWRWPKEFFLEFNLRPFKKPILGHGDTSSLDQMRAVLVSILYYFYQIPAVLVGFFPWSVFLGPTAVDAIQRLREGKKATKADKDAARWRDGTVLALCWFSVWFVFWSICKTKLPHYLLPAYPALALLTACFIDRWMSAAEAVKEKKTVQTPFPLSKPWALRNAWISTILVGIGIMVAVPWVTDKYEYLFGEESLGRLGLLGLLLALGGIWCWSKTMHERHEEAVIVFAITAVAFLTAVFGLAAKQIDPLQNAKPMMKAICDDEKSILHPVSPIATYGLFRESTVFYAGKPVTKCQNNETTGRTAKDMLADFLAKPGRSYVIMTAEDAAKVEKMFPGELKEIHRKPRFLADGEMVVLRHAG